MVNKEIQLCDNRDTCDSSPLLCSPLSQKQKGTCKGIGGNKGHRASHVSHVSHVSHMTQRRIEGLAYILVAGFNPAHNVQPTRFSDTESGVEAPESPCKTTKTFRVLPALLPEAPVLPC